MWNISKITDENGAEVKYLYDKLNRLACIQNPLNQEQKYSYDPNGNIREITQNNGSKIQYTYDEMNRRTSIQDADGAVTKYKYSKHGEIAEIEDALGNTTQFKYDSVGQMIEKVDKLGHKTTMSYTKLGKIETITYANGSVVSYSYYPGGKLKSVCLPDGNTETYEYDLNGNLSRKTNSLGHSYTYVYDELDQVIEIINPEGNAREFCYDVVGNVTKTEDENGNITHYYYSCVGNLIRVVDALGNESCYDYNKTSQLTRVEQYGLIDAELGAVEKQKEAAQVTLYEYDLLGRVTSITDSLGNKELLEYDEMGNVVKKEDKEGFTTAYEYSETGNLTHILYADKKEVAFSYNPLKQLIQIEDWLGTTTAKLDALGRPLEIKDFKEEEVRYTWGSMGERTQVSYPDGTAVDYTYNEAMKLISLAVNGEEKASYHYDSLGRLTSKVLGNGIQTDYTYNAFHRYESLIHHDREGILDRYDYHYDAVQNKIGITKARRDLEEDTGEFRYHYDELHRLTHVWKDDTSIANYEYDAFGNRITSTEKQQSKQYHYNKNNQLIETITNDEVQAFKYDKRGNLLEKRVQEEVDSTYTFDARNHLAKITQAGMQSQFVYNGLGSRVERQKYDLDKPQLLASEKMLNDYTKTDHHLLTSQTEEGHQNYFWDNETILGAISAEKEVEQFYLDDQLGSPIRLIENGNVQATYGYDTFGSPLSQTNSTPPRFGFTGHQTEEVGNLYFAEKRYLDAEEGRFISEDTVKGSIYVPKTMHAYAYCFNQPVDFIDTDGAFPSVKDFQDGLSNVKDSVVNAWDSGVDTMKDFWDNNVVGTDEILKEDKEGNIVHRITQHIGGDFIVHEKNKKTKEGSWSINIPEIPVPFSDASISLSINLNDMSISNSYNFKGKNGEVTSFAMTMDKKGFDGSVKSGVTSVTGLSDMYIYSDSDTDIPWEDMPVKEILEALGYSVVGSLAIIGLAMDDATGVLVADDVFIPVAAKEIMKSWVRVGAACAGGI
ncbi:RHS repeat-associated core domain-containing protein [Listeria seeligeri]|uniref:RHS repeat-associated core domain-containing protein n=1 Tax=Listeria seeligeri TaxID=1640 RepID=UPI0030D5276F